MAEEVVPGDLEIADELIAERRTEKPGETPEDMTPWQRPITGWIDLINDWAGKILCLLMVLDRGCRDRSVFPKRFWHHGRVWLG